MGGKSRGRIKSKITSKSKKGRRELPALNLNPAPHRYFTGAGAGVGADSIWLFCWNMDLKSEERFHTSLNET